MTSIFLARPVLTDRASGSTQTDPDRPRSQRYKASNQHGAALELEVCALQIPRVAEARSWQTQQSEHAYQLRRAARRTISYLPQRSTARAGAHLAQRTGWLRHWFTVAEATPLRPDRLLGQVAESLLSIGLVLRIDSDRAVKPFDGLFGSAQRQQGVGIGITQPSNPGFA